LYVCTVNAEENQVFSERKRPHGARTAAFNNIVRSAIVRQLLLTNVWPPCVADADITFLPCGFFYLLSFFPRLISAVADWMSTIFPHTVWP